MWVDVAPVAVDIHLCVYAQTVGLRGRPGLVSDFPLRSLFQRKKLCEAGGERKGKGEGEKGG